MPYLCVGGGVGSKRRGGEVRWVGLGGRFLRACVVGNERGVGMKRESSGMS